MLVSSSVLVVVPGASFVFTVLHFVKSPMSRKPFTPYLAVCFLLAICFLLLNFPLGKKRLPGKKAHDLSGRILDVQNETLGVCISFIYSGVIGRTATDLTRDISFPESLWLHSQTGLIREMLFPLPHHSRVSSLTGSME